MSAAAADRVYRAPSGRMAWTPELHSMFVSAVEQLGGARSATPRDILALMPVPGLSRDNVKSHLQKYRQMLAVQGSLPPASLEEMEDSMDAAARGRPSLPPRKAQYVLAPLPAQPGDGGAIAPAPLQLGPTLPQPLGGAAGEPMQLGQLLQLYKLQQRKQQELGAGPDAPTRGSASSLQAAAAAAASSANGSAEGAEAVMADGLSTPDSHLTSGLDGLAHPAAMAVAQPTAAAAPAAAAPAAADAGDAHMQELLNKLLAVMHQLPPAMQLQLQDPSTLQALLQELSVHPAAGTLLGAPTGSQAAAVVKVPPVALTPPSSMDTPQQAAAVEACGLQASESPASSSPMEHDAASPDACKQPTAAEAAEEATAHVAAPAGACSPVGGLAEVTGTAEAPHAAQAAISEPAVVPAGGQQPPVKQELGEQLLGEEAPAEQQAASRAGTPPAALPAQHGMPAVAAAVAESPAPLAAAALVDAAPTGQQQATQHCTRSPKRTAEAAAPHTAAGALGSPSDPSDGEALEAALLQLPVSMRAQARTLLAQNPALAAQLAAEQKLQAAKEAAAEQHLEKRARLEPPQHQPAQLVAGAPALHRQWPSIPAQPQQQPPSQQQQLELPQAQLVLMQAARQLGLPGLGAPVASTAAGANPTLHQQLLHLQQQLAVLQAPQQQPAAAGAPGLSPAAMAAATMLPAIAAVVEQLARDKVRQLSIQCPSNGLDALFVAAAVLEQVELEVVAQLRASA